MANVLFKRGTLEKYNALVQAGTVDANTIYFITDAQKIYLGDKLYAEGQDLFITKAGTSEVTGTINATSGKIIVAKPTANDESANKLYVDEAINSIEGVLQSLTDAMVFKGTVGEGGTPGTLPTEYKVGYSYKVITAGTYAGQKCEIGDMLVAVSVSDPVADSDWIVIQSNIDGAVTAKFSDSNAGKLPKIAAGNSLEPTDIDPTTLATSSRVDEVEAAYKAADAVVTKGYKDADSALKTELESKITDAATVWETLA